jgi:acyl-CoA synthetase (AMP-forming)/AMP-acid ligase II
LGEKVVLLIKSKEILEQDLLNKISCHLGVYEIPKQIIPVDKIPMTPNGKIDRKAAKELAKR